MAGTDSSRVPVTGGPAVVLVAPQMGENIGACARAMLNFGLTELRLVRPRDGWPNEQARAMASRADSVLDEARVFDSTADAVADRHLVLATTARPRELVKAVLTPRQAAALSRSAVAAGERVAWLFGAERAGLDNDDVARAHAIVQVPANPAFASINLAQAVLLMGYEWFQAVPEPRGNDGLGVPATAAEMESFHGRLEAALDAAGFLKPPEKRPHMVRNIRSLFQRLRPTEQELRTLHGIVSALLRR